MTSQSLDTRGSWFFVAIAQKHIILRDLRTIWLGRLDFWDQRLTCTDSCNINYYHSNCYTESKMHNSLWPTILLFANTRLNSFVQKPLLIQNRQKWLLMKSTPGRLRDWWDGLRKIICRTIKLFWSASNTFYNAVCLNKREQEI